MQLETKYQKHVNDLQNFPQIFAKFQKKSPTHHKVFRDFVFRDFAR